MANYLQYISVYENVLDLSYCNFIINAYEKNDIIKTPGETESGYTPHIKDTLDYYFYSISDPSNNFHHIEQTLQRVIYTYLTKYIDSLEYADYKPFRKEILADYGFQIQKYRQGSGKYLMHQDGNIKWDIQFERVVTFIIYLNTIDEGGETDFGYIKIKPEAGKLVLFPSTWSYPHKGCVPISSDKYIVTGWFYRVVNNKLFGDNIKCINVRL